MATRPSAPTRKRAGGTDDGVADPALPQKKRARHRLIGAIALCLLAAVVVPLLLESEPSRPSTDVALVIPSRDTPLPPRGAEGAARDPAATRDDRAERGGRAPDGKGAAAGTVARGTVDGGPSAGARDGGGGASPKDGEPGATGSRTTDAKGTDAKGADAKGADAKGADAKGADPKAAGTKDAGAKDEIQRLAETAQARGRGDAAGGRYLLQVGAFGGESGANAAVGRVEAAGLDAFTEKVKTDRGMRVRVRVGPFATREAAEQARARLKAAGIEAAVIAP
jgi:DedD protein